MRLVKQHHSDLVGTTHLHLAQQLEAEHCLPAAESHYLAADQWQAAVKMYRSLDMWEDAHRVSPFVKLRNVQECNRVFLILETSTIDTRIYNLRKAERGTTSYTLWIR